MSSQYNRIWYGLDLFKFGAAVLIVFRHTYNSDWGIAGAWINQVLTSASVPFFFLVSGFLLRHGIEKSLARGGEDEERLWFRKYLSRVIIMYVAWTILTLPVAFLIVNRGHPDYGAGMKILYHLRLFFFTGSIGYYWYLLTLVISALIIRWSFKKRCTSWLLFIASLLFLWGCAYDSPLNKQQPCFEILHIVFGSTRNFLNTGLFYMTVGFLFPALGEKACPRTNKYLSILCLLVCVIIRTIETLYFKTPCAIPLVAISSFFVALSFDFHSVSRYSEELRKLSIAIYLLHCPFILSFDFYLRRGTLIDFPLALAFSLATYYLLTRLIPKCSGVLFGYPATRVSEGNKQ